MDRKQDEGYRVPMSSPDLTEAERAVVADVLGSPRLSMGPYEEAFEKAVKEYAGVRHAIAVSSGTAGLHLCVRAAGISDGDWVITTPFSFVASANVMLYERAIPIFVDVEAITGNIDIALVEEAARDLKQGGKVSQRWLPRKGIKDQGALKAILPVDVFGQPVNYDPLLRIAKTFGLSIIEDSCEALGSTYRGRKAGVFGDAGIYAFYPNKQITTGEGGVVVTDNDAWASMIRSMRNQGRAPGDTWLSHTYLGYNYRLDELSAALGAVQMTRLDELIGKREQVAQWYLAQLKELQGVEAPQVVSSTTRMSWFVFVIRIDPSLKRDVVVDLLKERGIPARPYFIPIHLQNYMRERFDYWEGDFPVTEDLGRRGLALPFSSVMTREQVEEVCQALREVMEIS
ncbi:MAG: polysaccharide biosynthesis protein [Chloroflexi bacterium RBG_16_48_8]|nr:MAG: polysaccharide biosynthesis protein [Chloroflexi bacterium RBG_16_48_8]